MKNWLIKLLGGFTRSELNAVGVKADARIEAFDEQLQFWHELLESREKEVQRLTDLMLARAGFLVTAVAKELTKEPKPINNRKSWPAIQRELEREDAKKQVDRTEQHWREKEAASQVSDGNQRDARDGGTSPELDQRDGTTGLGN